MSAELVICIAAVYFAMALGFWVGHRVASSSAGQPEVELPECARLKPHEARAIQGILIDHREPVPESLRLAARGRR